MGLDENELWNTFAVDCGDAVRGAEECLLRLEHDPGRTSDINGLYRGLHTLKGNSGFLRLRNLEILAHRAEDLVGLVRDGGVTLDVEIVDLMLAVVDRFRVLVDTAVNERRDVPPEAIDDLEARVGALATQRAQGVGPGEAVAQPEPRREEEPEEDIDDFGYVQALDPASDPGYLEVFLGMAAEALPQLGAAIVAIQGQDAADGRARLAAVCEDLTLACDRMGFVHVIDALGAIRAAAERGALTPAEIAGVTVQELAVYRAVVDIEHRYAAMAEAPRSFGLRDLYRAACAGLVFADLARLGSIVTAPIPAGSGELRAVLTRLREACAHSAVPGGEIACLELEDHLGRALDLTSALDRDAIARTHRFVQHLGAQFAGEGEEEAAIPAPAPPPESVDLGAVASVALTEAQRAQLTVAAVSAIVRLRSCGGALYDVIARVDGAPDLAERFLAWLRSDGLELVSSAVETIDGALVSRFLVGTAAGVDVATPLRSLDPSGRSLVAKALFGASIAPDVAAKPARAEAPVAAAPAAPPARERPDDGEDDLGRGDMARTEFLRIDARKVSLILDLAAELGLAVGAVTRHPTLEGLELEGFSAASHNLEMLVSELQNEVSGMRLVPVAGVFQRMKRVVRDALRRTGKKATLEIVGDDTEIDKLMVDALQEPLMHVLRNAVDHGIESEAERVQAGKDPTGRIALVASHHGGEVRIEVLDDGRGLDRPAILTRARARGLVSPDAHPTDGEIDQFIFLPGFSTKSVVDELSGRGVGMDVLKTAIEGLRGRVVLSSTPGRGSRIAMSMPLTLAFVEAMIVRERDRLYAVPIEKVEEVFRANAAQVSHSSALGRTLLRVRDTLVPVLWLHRYYGDGNVDESLDGRTVVVVQARGRAVALPVDALIGNQQVMLKPLPLLLSTIRAAAGCGMLRSGDVALALDCDRLDV